MISKRGLLVAGALSAGSVLLAAGSAFACQIGDFTPSTSCDASTPGSPMTTVTVVDKDVSNTTATVTVAQLVNGVAGDVLGTLTFQHAGQSGGESQSVSVPYVPGAVYQATVNAGNYVKNKTVNTTAVPDDAKCDADKSTPTPTDKPTGTATPTAAPAPKQTPTDTPSASASASGTVLAETGGGSNAPMMIGIAAALVVVGGGALYTVRRRSAAQNG